jgi:hypothetical protein
LDHCGLEGRPICELGEAGEEKDVADEEPKSCCSHAHV